jgi:hypothetical protein
MNTAGRLPFLLQQFFTKRLVNQQQVSSHTIASYRDTFQRYCQLGSFVGVLTAQSNP